MKISLWFPSAGQASSKTSGALGLALSAVDRVAGRKAREGLESQVDQIAQSKWGVVVVFNAS